MIVICFENLRQGGRRISGGVDNRQLRGMVRIVVRTTDALGFFTLLVFILTILCLQLVVRMLLDLSFYDILSI